MTSILMNVVLQVAVVGAAPQTHQTDYAAAKEKAKPQPVVVLVGAEWCDACMVMKNEVMPAVKKAGALKDVLYFYVDVDNDPKMAKRFLKGNSIPQLVRLEKQEKGWHIDRLTGAHRPEKVVKFVKHIDVHTRTAGKTEIGRALQPTPATVPPQI